jgi:hypothetical protein
MSEEQVYMKAITNKQVPAGHQWLTSIILATWEAEVKRISIQGQQVGAWWGKAVLQTISQQTPGCGGMHSLCQATQVDEIKRISPRPAGGKSLQDPTSNRRQMYSRDKGGNTRGYLVQVGLDKM